MYKFDKFKEFRILNGFTQVQIADYLNMTQTNYSDIENGKVIPNAIYLLKLSELYKCTPNDLLNIRDIYLEAMSKLDK